jgi:hypothetical protein
MQSKDINYFYQSCQLYTRQLSLMGVAILALAPDASKMEIQAIPSDVRQSMVHLKTHPASSH